MTLGGAAVWFPLVFIMRFQRAIFCRLCLMAGLWAGGATLTVHAGGGAFNTLVVVNTNSAESVELGEYYASQHGIPTHQICSVGIATNTATLTPTNFFTLLRDPILAHIAAENLTGQIDYVVLCGDLPTRVRDVEGVTASLFYGFQNAPSVWEVGACNLPLYTTNNYYRAERAFRSVAGWNNTNGFVAFHLLGTNLANAKLVADRGVAAQSTFPAGTIYLYNLGDGPRGWREQLFGDAQFSFTALPGLPAECFIAAPWATLNNKTNVMGYHDGCAYLTAGAKSTNNTWLAGAYADHMTSYGGRLLDTNHNQNTVLDWFGIGATASYGTVAEPCSYIEKYPDPFLGFLYARGFTIGEAYAMAVFAPYQGLFAGDPLAAPYAAPPVITVSQPTNNQIVTGTVTVAISATAHARGVPAAGFDLFVDNRLRTNLVTLAPTPGNQLAVAVAGRTNSVTVAANDTLFDVVNALADAVNNDATQTVYATAFGDRLELIHRQFDHAGDNAAVSATVAQGTADSLTLGVGLAATNIAPSPYHARKMVWLATRTGSGANANDKLTCIITLTNGVAITNTLVATQGEAVTNILERLRQAINTNSTLQATNGVSYAHNSQYPVNYGYLTSRTPGPDGYGIVVDYRVTAVSNTTGLATNSDMTTFLDDNARDTRARASILFHVRPTNGTLAAEYALDTTALADGHHTLDIIARDGSAVAAQSRQTLTIFVANGVTSQGTPHWWLAQHGWTNDFENAALADTDNDGVPAWQEYLADTDPTDADSFPWLEFLDVLQDPPVLTWPASPARAYQIHYADDLFNGPWVTQQLLQGASEWADTNPPPATNRFYRLFPHLP